MHNVISYIFKIANANWRIESACNHKVHSSECTQKSEQLEYFTLNIISMLLCLQSVNTCTVQPIQFSISTHLIFFSKYLHWNLNWNNKCTQLSSATPPPISKSNFRSHQKSFSCYVNWKGNENKTHTLQGFLKSCY